VRQPQQAQVVDHVDGPVRLLQVHSARTCATRAIHPFAYNQSQAAVGLGADAVEVGVGCFAVALRLWSVRRWSLLLAVGR
jgi:hypothetical protein